MTAQPPGERTCEACGAPLERKRHQDGQLEPPSAYARRRFCNTSCSARAQHAAGTLNRATPWRDGPAVPPRGPHPQLHPDRTFGRTALTAAPAGTTDRRDAAAFARALGRETDASLRADPSRWPWATSKERRGEELAG